MTKSEMLSSLLARIHGDGGHYEQQHGTKKAVEDADAKVVAMGQARHELHIATTELIALYGTNKMREMNTYTFTHAITALAYSCLSGCDAPVTLAHAPDVDKRMEELRKEEANAPDWSGQSTSRPRHYGSINFAPFFTPDLKEELADGSSSIEVRYGVTPVPGPAGLICEAWDGCTYVTITRKGVAEKWHRTNDRPEWHRP